MKFLKVSVVFYFWMCACSAATGPTHGKIVACYFASWSVYRPGRGSFAIENIDPTLCTHLIYSFAQLDVATDGIRSLDPWQDLAEDYGKGGYGRFVKLKDRYPHLKVSIAIGGWDDASKKYSLMAADIQRRSRFVRSALEFIKKYNFDGLDLNWEYPGRRGGSPQDKQNFVFLVKELRAAFNKHNLLLTAAFGARKDIIDVAYDVASLSVYLDFIHMMCYDYHGAWDRVTGANAPLKGNDGLTVEYAINYMLQMGADPSKLVMGIPLYGRTFLTTQSSSSPTLGVTAKSVGFSGPYLREDGFMSFQEICLELKNTSVKWSKYWDDDTRTPFAVADEKVISYDDPRSIMEKVRFAMEKNLAGCTAYALDKDDFKGDCSVNVDGFVEYPLMRSINKYIHQSLKDIERDNEINDEKCFKAFMTCNMKRCYTV